MNVLYYCIAFVDVIYDRYGQQEHKNCGEMTEIEAKVKYVKLARSLRTYGVSFFLVKVFIIYYSWSHTVNSKPLH